MTYAKQGKKLLIMNILEILRTHTDEDHRLSQKEIADILRTQFDMSVERKAVKRNLMDLIDFGYNIEYSESVRMTPNPKTGELEESCMLSDFYLVRDFTDGELRLLIDSLLFSKHIPYSQCKELVEKLEGLSNRYFRSRVRHIRTMPDTAPQNKQLFLNIETIDEAITNGKQIAFHYNAFGTDKKLHPRTDSTGNAREYIVNPYQIAAANGRYYLICNYDKYDNVSNYRLDRITDIRLLDTPVKPMRQVKGLEHGFDLPKHMAEHIYMFGGESAPVTFTAKKYILNDVMDWFGTDVTFLDETEDDVTVKVTVNLASMRLWALQYALHARIISPPTLADAVRQDLQKAVENYAE